MTERKGSTMQKHFKSEGVREALRATALPARRPTEADRPPPQPFAGPERKALPGQMKLGETNNDAA